MPLNTSITRDGEDLSLRWGGFHVAAMVVAAAWDSGEGPFEVNEPDVEGYPDEPCPITPGDAFSLMSYPVIGTTPLNSGPYTLKGEHRFVDVTDGEVLHLLPGDVLSASRSSRW